MGATAVVMPQMGLEVVEATITAIHVEVGGAVRAGQPVVEVETDKALTEVEATCDGVVQSIAVEVGATIPVGATLVTIGSAAGPVAGSPTASGHSSAPEPAPRQNGRGRLRAAPVARRAAEALGVDLASVTGSGPAGRITLRDVEAAASSPAPPAVAPSAVAAAATAPAPPGEGASRVAPLDAIRRAMARRMTESAGIPQFSLEREIDAGWLLAEKERLASATGAPLSVNDLLVQALAETITRRPELAACYVPESPGQPAGLQPAGDVAVGLAVATDRGLLVPVLHAADRASLPELAQARARLVASARQGTLTREEMTGASISLSNLAAYAVDRFTAMLNPGETAILAVGRTVDRVVPRDRGLGVVPTLTLTLTLDHRAIDGAGGGAVLALLAELLEGEMPWRV